MTSGRYTQRKAETRRRIRTAAHALFLEKGYAGTSMEDISVAAEVAIRTLYLHFDSKAAILLDYFDSWLDEFVRLVGERAAGERLDVAVDRALATMRADGWDDDRTLDRVPTMPPVLEFIGSGAPEIAGHLMQRWVAAQDRLTELFRAASGADPDDPAARIEASAVFAAWMTAVLHFRARFGTASLAPSSHDIGSQAIRAYVEGLGRALT